MLLKTSEGLKLAEKKVKYTRDGEEIEKVVGEEGQQWWNDFAAKWEHTTIVEFMDMVYTPEQLARFEEIKNMNSIAENILNDYVMDGVIGSGLEMLSLQKENDELRSLLADLTETVLLGGN